MLFSGIFHARRMKKFLFSGGLILAIVLITFLRILRPERFVNPELFANLTLFITEMKASSFILLPNRWLGESIFHFLNKGININTLIFISLLFLTSYVTAVMLLVVFKKFHYKGWALLQEGEIVHFREKMLRAAQSETFPERMEGAKKVSRFLSFIHPQSRVLLKKDLFCQMRDEKNIHQMLILLSLIVIYLFSISALPMNWEVYYAAQIKYIVSFFNLGLILVILASLCSRLVYPAVVSEGAFLWLLKTSPVSSGRYGWTKFLLFFIPLFIVGQLLIISSSFFIGIEKTFVILSILTVTLVCASFVGMSIAFGISNMKKRTSDTQREQIRTGSTAYMLASVLLILVTLVLEIIPTFLYFLKEAKQGVFTQKVWILIGAVIFVLLLMNSFVTVISMRLSMKKIDNLQPN
jgi:ABC-2 type transport system permease protein